MSPCYQLDFLKPSYPVFEQARIMLLCPPQGVFRTQDSPFPSLIYIFRNRASNLVNNAMIYALTPTPTPSRNN